MVTHERLRVDSIDWTIEHKYDSTGNTSYLIYSTGTSISYQPNALGFPTRVGMFAKDVSYHPNGQYQSFTHENRCINTLSLYNSGLPNTQKSTCNGNVAVHNQYHWDSNGNLTYWNDKQSNAYDIRLTYDQLDRLDNIRSADYTLVGDLNYDTMGNIKKFDSVVGTAINYHYNNNQRLTSTSGYQQYVFNYDERGNVTYNGRHNFVYNLANQMIEAGGNSYGYDGFGKRVKTNDNNGVRYSMYTLDGRLIQESIRGENREYYYLGSQLVGQQDAGGKSYIHTDLLGSTAAESNNINSNVERNRYGPYGAAWGSSPDDEIGYTGHKQDTDIGLIYMQARYYDPVIGRFYSNDPIGFRDVHSFNRYAYANNNPYKYTDPDGRDAVSVQIEYNLPSAISMLNASSFVTDTLGVTIPEGFNVSATVSFPGFSDNGKWGFGGSFNAVFGGEFGVDESVAKASGIKDTLKSVGQAFGSGSLTGEIDYNFAKNGVTDVQNGLSDNQISTMAGVGGGQVSVNNNGDLTGFGIKAGAGINAGAVVEQPIVGFAIEEDKGFVKTGGN